MFSLSAVSLVLIYSQNFLSSTVEIHTRIIRKIFNCVILQKLLFCWIIPYWWNWNHFHFIFVWNLRNLPRWSRLRYWFLRSLKWSPSWCGQNSHLRGHNEPQGRNFFDRISQELYKLQTSTLVRRSAEGRTEHTKILEIRSLFVCMFISM